MCRTSSQNSRCPPATPPRPSGGKPASTRHRPDLRPMSDPISVVIADRRVLWREVIADALNCEPDIAVVGEAGDSVTTADILSACKPDVALLGYRLDGGAASE